MLVIGSSLCISHFLYRTPISDFICKIFPLLVFCHKYNVILKHQIFLWNNLQYTISINNFVKEILLSSFGPDRLWKNGQLMHNFEVSYGL